MKYYLLTKVLYSFEAENDNEAIEICEGYTDMETESESYMSLTADGLRLVKDYE